MDLDKLEATLARIAPRLDLELPRGEKITLQFARLDDFHPDRIWEHNEFFAPHRGLRAELTNPATFATAMASVGTQGRDEPLAQPPAGAAADLFSSLMGSQLASTASSRTPAAVVETMIKQAVASHVVSGPDPRQAEIITAFDAAVSGQMRSLLHHPHFQALEAAWRGVDFLLRNVDTDESLEVCLLDVSREELAADLRAADDLAASAIGEIIAEQPVGARPWTVVAGLFAFQPNEDDADLLARIAKIAAASGLPFLAGAGPQFLEAALARTGGSEPLLAWQKLRNLPEARNAGLVAPRFLLRLPYGRDADAIDHFAFEEMPPAAEHDGLLWGNPALIGTLLLANSWRDEGWSFAPPVNAEVNGLPVHIFTESGEKKLTPCGEVLLTDRVAENLLALGVMPLASVRDRDAVRLLRFQSIAQPATALAGL